MNTIKWQKNDIKKRMYRMTTSRNDEVIKIIVAGETSSGFVHRQCVDPHLRVEFTP